MRHPAGHKIAAHVHNLQLRQVLYTQEVLFLRRGKVKVNLYSTSRDPIGSRNPVRGRHHLALWRWSFLGNA